MPPHGRNWLCGGIVRSAPLCGLSLSLMARPHSLNAPIGTKPDGTKITTRSAILEWLETGLPFDTSLAHAGISRSSVNQWLLAAARAQRRVEIDRHAKLTPHERDLIVFSRQVDKAVAVAEAKYWTVMNTLAEGGARRTVVTVKTERNAAGQDVEVERTTRVEQMLPSLGALKWVLDRRIDSRKLFDARVDEAMSDEDAAVHLGDAMELWLSTRDADAPKNANGHVNGSNGNGSAHPSH